MDTYWFGWVKLPRYRREQPDWLSLCRLRAVPGHRIAQVAQDLRMVALQQPSYRQNSG